jgi:hypothetical protein
MIVAAICAIPRAFRRGDRSPVDLVAASGYRDVRDTLNDSQIRAQLARDPSLIEDWALWSQNKRTSDGWYFTLHGAGGSVGCVGSADPEHLYPSSAEACAQFILREVAGIDSHNTNRDRTT